MRESVNPEKRQSPIAIAKKSCQSLEGVSSTGMLTEGIEQYLLTLQREKRK